MRFDLTFFLLKISNMCKEHFQSTDQGELSECWSEWHQRQFKAFSYYQESAFLSRAGFGKMAPFGSFQWCLFEVEFLLKFFRLSFRNCKSCVYYNCDEILWCNYIGMSRWRQSEYRYCFFFPSQRHDVQAYNSHAKDEASFSTVQKRLFSSEPSFLPSTIRSSRYLWNLSSSQMHKEKPETTFVWHNIVVEFT